MTDTPAMPTGESGGRSASLTVWTCGVFCRGLRCCLPVLQEVAMPAAFADRPLRTARAFGHPRHARPWRLVALSALAGLLALLGPPAALAHPPGTT
jgi:hypothetical protein